MRQGSIVVEDPHRPFRSGYSTGYVNRERTSVSRHLGGIADTIGDKITELLPLLGGMVFAAGLIWGVSWLNDRYSIFSKVESFFKGKEELCVDSKMNASRQGTSQRASTLAVVCCKCNARIEIVVPRNGQDNIQIVCPRCAEQLIVVQNPVKVPQMIWVQGRYVDQRLPGGSIVRAWLPGHYEQRN